MKVYYDSNPDAILYQPLPDGTANVYLRKNIEQAERSTFNEDKEEKMTVWTADEKQIITTMTKDEVTASLIPVFVCRYPYSDTGRTGNGSGTGNHGGK